MVFKTRSPYPPPVPVFGIRTVSWAAREIKPWLRPPAPQRNTREWIKSLVRFYPGLTKLVLDDAPKLRPYGTKHSIFLALFQLAFFHKNVGF